MSEKTTAAVTETDAQTELEIEKIQSKNKRYLTPKEIIAFCIVNFGQKNLEEFLNTKLQYFTIQFLGVSAKAYANLTLATGIYDAVDDTISGLIIDRTRTRWGRVKPYLILPMPLWIISTIMLFSVPNIGYTGKLVWLCTGMLLRGLGMSYFGAWYLILYNNTPNLNERNNLITSSEFAKLFGTWLLSLLPVFLDIGRSVGTDEPKVYGGFAFFIVAITAVSCIYGFFNMRERVPLLSREEMNKVSIKDSFKEILHNRPMFVLVFANFFNSFKSIGSGVEQFFWFNCTGAYSYATITGIFTGLPNYIMTPLTGKWMNKYGARNTIICGGLFGAVAYSLMWIIGYHPFGESFEQNKILNLVWLIIALTVCGLPNSILRVCLPSLTGDMYDYSEWKSGMRNEALVSTIQNYFLKVGYNINGWLAGMVLAWVNYTPMYDNDGGLIPNTDPGVLKGLWAIFALAPAAARLLTGLSFFFFNVHGEFKQKMLADLAERRERTVEEAQEAENEAETEE